MWRTWAQELRLRGGDVLFFGGEGAVGGAWCGLPLVSLAGVGDSDYPPQRKSLLMLSWLARHWGHRAKWFLRADDDIFVKVVYLIN